MTNLYARLVKHVKKREDFWTDALVDLLERLLREDCEKDTGRFREFVSEVLLADPTDKAQRACFLDMLKDVPLDALSIKTRYRIPQGRIPDIVVFNRGRPICVVEVKVDAPIGPGQLEGCGEFLREAEDAHGNLTALVLLTHVTSPPDGFTDPACNAYRVSLRSAASWSNTAEWFQKLSSEDNGVDEPLKSLAREFSEFLRKSLKEYDMPTLDDVAIARLHNIKRLYDALTGAVKKMGDGYLFPANFEKCPIGYNPSGIDRYHKHPQSGRGIGYGLCFQCLKRDAGGLCGCQRCENDNPNDPKPIEIGDGLYAYVYVFIPPDQFEKIPGYSVDKWYERNQAGGLTPAQNSPHVNSKGWWYYNEPGEAYYAKICPIQELLDPDGRIGNKLQKWAHEVLGDAVKLWKALNP